MQYFDFKNNIETLSSKVIRYVTIIKTEEMFKDRIL